MSSSLLGPAWSCTVSLLPLNVGVLLFFCILTRRSLKWLVALTENVKGKDKTKDFLSQTVISERAGPGCLRGWSVDLEGFVQWQIRGHQRSHCPWDPRGPHCSPCLLKQCRFNCWPPDAEQPSFPQMDRPPPPERLRNKDQSSRNIQALDASVVLFFNV